MIMAGMAIGKSTALGESWCSTGYKDTQHISEFVMAVR
jgi:hypothetical protein